MKIFDVKVHWTYGGEIPTCTRERIRKCKDLLANLGVTLEEFYMDDHEYMIVSKGDERIKINAHFTKVDGSWLTIE